MEFLKLNLQMFANRDTTIGVDIDFDISEVKKQINVLNGKLEENKYAWQQIAAEAENWSKTADGVEDRIASLNEKYKLQESLVAKIGKELNLYSGILSKNHPTMVRLQKELAKEQAEWSKTGAELEKQKRKLIEVDGEYKTLDEILNALDADLKLANSEFSKATAGMDKWEDSTKGLNAKLTQLNSVAGTQEKKVETLKKEYQKLVDAKEENSEEAKKLLTSLNNEETALAKTRKELEKYGGELAQSKAKAGDLKTRIEELTNKYKKLEQQEGNNKDALKKMKQEIKDCTDEHEAITREIKQQESASEQLENATDDLSGKFTVLKGVVSQLIADGIKKLASETVDAAKQMIDAGISFESAFAGVRKTINASEEEFAVLKSDILDMSTRVASSADDIASVMEMAGQLGIANENLTDFTETMIRLGDSTNMGAGEAAETLARFQNITGMSQKDFEKLGSTLVALGNNYATTEGEIMTMALRLAGAGTQVGMSETDILGLATALSSVGIEAEMGGKMLCHAC